MSENRKNLLDKVHKTALLREGSLVVLSSPMEPSGEDGIVSSIRKLGLRIEQITIPMKPVGFFWKVHDKKGHKAYLLGTTHFAKEELFKLNSKIQSCFHKSQAVAVEIDITRPDVIESVKKTPFKDQMLFDSLEEPVRDMVLKCCEFLAFTLKIALIKPQDGQSDFEILSSYLSKIKVNLRDRSGYGSGIDLDFIQKAKAAGKPVHDLETISSTFDPSGDLKEFLDLFFDALLTKDPESSIEEVMYEIRKTMTDRIEKPLDYLSRSFSFGYTEKLMEFYNLMPEKATHHFHKRNLLMTSKIDTLIQGSPDRFFFMVGALHLPGEHGMLKLLEGFGYKAQRVIAEEPL